MKRRKIWIHTVFLTLIALSLVFFCFETQRQYRIDMETDDIFGGSFTIFVCFLAFFPAFCFEIELYRVVRYFALCRQKTQRKTVINLLSLFLLPLLFLAVIILNQLMFDASNIILTCSLIIAPLHFILMRIVAFCWWCNGLEREVSL